MNSEPKAPAEKEAPPIDESLRGIRRSIRAFALDDSALHYPADMSDEPSTVSESRVCEQTGRELVLLYAHTPDAECFMVQTIPAEGHFSTYSVLEDCIELRHFVAIGPRDNWQLLAVERSNNPERLQLFNECLQAATIIANSIPEQRTSS